MARATQPHENEQMDVLPIDLDSRDLGDSFMSIEGQQGEPCRLQMDEPCRSFECSHSSRVSDNTDGRDMSQPKRVQ